MTEEIVKSALSKVMYPGFTKDIVTFGFVNNLDIKSAFPILGIQNYLKYKFGRKIRTKITNIKKFKEKLKEWEENFNSHSLFLSKMDFNIHPAKSYPKPFRKRDRTEVEVRLPGRLISKYKNQREMLGISQNRIIHVMNCTVDVNKWITVKITNTKDNIFYAQEIAH